MELFNHEWVKCTMGWISTAMLTILSGITQSLLLGIITFITGLITVGYTIHKWYWMHKNNKSLQRKRVLEEKLLQRQIDELEQ